MIRRNPNGDYPKIDKTAYIDSSAVIIGKISIGKNVFVAPGAVIRADEIGSSVSIGNNSNIQDGVIIHALGKSSVIIGRNTSLSHGCVIHGPCKIGKSCFIGFGSVVFKAIIKDGIFVKSLAVIEGVKITDKKIIPNGAVIDSPRMVELLRFVSKKETAFARKVTVTNLRLAKDFRNAYPAFALACRQARKTARMNVYIP